MSDEVLNIKVTEAELDLITCLLEQAGTMEDSDGQPAFELLHDLMEQAARPGDWTSADDELVICDAEMRMFNAGTEAREQVKGTSCAAARRSQRFGEFEVKERELSEQQRHDLFENETESDERTKTSRMLCGNDPIEW